MADGSPKTPAIDDLVPAFAALYRQHTPMVRQALRQLGVAPGSLDDAVQDVFVVLHRRIDKYERDRSLKNWLWGIARGVASGYRRGDRRRGRLAAVLPEPDADALPDRGVARREAAAILDEFLGSLDDGQCAVFVLSELEGRRGPEIAALLDVNLNTVYARLRAARRRFQAAMERHRAPATRPLFAAWLPWAWPAWLGTPAVAAGAGTLAAFFIVRPAAIPDRDPRSGEPLAIASASMDSRVTPARVASRGTRSRSQVDAKPEFENMRPRHGIGPTRPRTRVSGAFAATEETETMTTLTLMLSTAMAFAPESIAEPTSQDADEAARVESEGDVSVYEFADDVLTGEHLSPDGQLIPWRRPAHHGSLIDVRGHFMAELVGLALDL